MADKKLIKEEIMNSFSAIAEKLSKVEKRNKQLLTALRSAKRIIKFFHNGAHGNMGKHFWKDYQNIPPMQRINKAIKDGKV